MMKIEQSVYCTSILMTDASGKPTIFIHVMIEHIQDGDVMQTLLLYIF